MFVFHGFSCVAVYPYVNFKVYDVGAKFELHDKIIIVCVRASWWHAGPLMRISSYIEHSLVVSGRKHIVKLESKVLALSRLTWHMLD